MNQKSDVIFDRPRVLKNTGFLHGVGIQDAPYQVDIVIDGSRVVCPLYQAWANIIKRCYNPRLHARNPTYVGCSVAPEWHRFSAFRAWAVGQDWRGNEVDKDILAHGNKVYSAETCVFVDHATNNLLTDSAAIRGAFPLGVHFSKGKYRAMCHIDVKQLHLGYFPTPAAAHAAWQQAKAGVIRRCADRQTDPRVKAALHGRADWLDRDRIAGHETLDFKGNFRPFDSAQTQTNVQHIHIAPDRVWIQSSLFEAAA